VILSVESSLETGFKCCFSRRNTSTGLFFVVP
jgi:hypothetical protein